jgi:electron transfer flavoprotein alpha subunit
MAVLVVADHSNAALSDATAKTITAAAAFATEIDVLVAGSGARPAAEAASRLAGVRKVVLAEGPAYEKQIAEAMTALIVPMMSGYDALLAPATTMGKNVIPRIAAKLDVMAISDVTAILDQSTFERPIYAGNAIMTVRSADPKKVLTVRTAAYQAAPASGSATIEVAEAPGGPFASTFVGEELSKSDRPELASAKRIVSGGRALASAEQFTSYILPLADKIGAGVGASRAAVDAGYAPNDYQVGQTGKVVAPELYVAVGISGAIQHLAGMKDSKIIVAINKDEEAPIFQIADYGLVADLFKAVPELTEKL